MMRFRIFLNTCRKSLFFERSRLLATGICVGGEETFYASMSIVMPDLKSTVSNERVPQRGLISSKQNFVDCSKPDICETVDIHSEVPRNVETVALLRRNRPSVGGNANV